MPVFAGGPTAPEKGCKAVREEVFRISRVDTSMSAALAGLSGVTRWGSVAARH